ncbi:hypothetical protein SERLA73DRAFT_189202 [Serpula lacrymans var. lacrymans S7.3]|uniref:Uncharacterized protein n=1 Tax=Serpula lacrymans var. lacrymans (strain S7.3) TaxID=936435 RepID=F8QD26_SERL3|nr:hypothetical protein SERLA73DRAFT_189202 [Serpula lacrymans var. lacrymans S7.3]
MCKTETGRYRRTALTDAFDDRERAPHCERGALNGCGRLVWVLGRHASTVSRKQCNFAKSICFVISALSVDERAQVLVLSLIAPLPYFGTALDAYSCFPLQCLDTVAPVQITKVIAAILC